MTTTDDVDCHVYRLWWRRSGCWDCCGLSIVVGIACGWWIVVFVSSTPPPPPTTTQHRPHPHPLPPSTVAVACGLVWLVEE